MDGFSNAESPREKLRKTLGLGKDATDEDFRTAFSREDSDGQAALEEDMKEVLGADNEDETLN